MKHQLICCLLVLFGLATAQGEHSTTTNIVFSTQETPTRIVSLSGFLTEMLHELGHLDKVVGRDMTSTYPAKTADIPNLGHVTQLNVEGILALRPDLILVQEDQTKQSKVFEQLQSAGIKMIIIATSFDFDNAINAANIIGKELGTAPNVINDLSEKIKADKIQLSSTLVKYKTAPKVLFIYARGAGRLMVGGQNTAMDAMIQKAGGRNAVEAFEGFRALTAEALLKAQPDVILMFDSGLKSLDGKAGLSQITGVTQTAAYQNNRIVTMDGHYLSSFGPRAVKAALELADKLHP